MTIEPVHYIFYANFSFYQKTIDVKHRVICQIIHPSIRNLVHRISFIVDVMLPEITVVILGFLEKKNSLLEVLLPFYQKLFQLWLFIIYLFKFLI